MNKSLRLLIVEDSEDDALLIRNELRMEFDLKWKRVETAEEMNNMLDQQTWDIIIADYSLPGFSGREALKIIKEREIDTPCIIVSSAVGEDIAVEAMKAGTKDYVKKDKLTRLVPAVKREIKEAEIRQKRRQTQQVKQESDDLFRALFEKNQAIILLLDVKDKNLPIVDVNEAAIDYYGYTKKQFLTMTIMDLNTLPAEQVRKIMAISKKERKSVFEFQHRLASGEIRDIESYSDPIDVHGRKLVYVIIHDITERKLAEEKIRVSEEKLRNFIHYSTMGIWCFKLEEPVQANLPVERLIDKFFAAICVECNETYAKMINTTKENILGMRLSDVMPDTEENRDYLRAFINNGFKLSGGISHEIDKKGEEKYFSNSMVATIIDGKLIESWGTQTDVTELKQAESALRESEERHRNLAENSPNAIVVHSEGKIVYVNNEAIKIIGGKSDHDYIGKSVTDFVHPDYHNLINKKVQENGAALILEEKFIRLDGRVIDVEVAAAIVDYNGKPASQVVFSDITHRKRAEIVQALLYRISNAVFITNDLNELYKVIRKELGTVMDISNFYIALYDKETDLLSFPIFKDDKDNFDTAPAQKTLTGYVIKKNKPLLLNKKGINKLAKTGEIEIIGTLPEVWLGIPLKAKNEVIGVLAVQSYADESAYQREELEILKFVSDQIGLSIERKHGDEEIKKSLKEKVVLLKEIHHRVKNNLQVVSSLLYLQSKYIKDPDALEVFQDSQNRVRSMSLVHEKLYQSESLFVIFVISLWSKQLVQCLTDYFFLGIAKYLFRTLIPICYITIIICHNNGILG